MSKHGFATILKALAVWVPTVLLGALFVLQGLMKFPAESPWPGMFRNWGFPENFHLVIGVLELLGGLFLFVPRLAGFAALTLAAVMTGACLTHLLHGETLQAGFTLILTVIFAILARVRLPLRHGRDRRSSPEAARAVTE